MQFKQIQLEKAFILLNEFLKKSNSPQYNLIVCGGAALIGANLINRVTKDVDIVALCDNNMKLIDPSPLPENLLKAAEIVAEELALTGDWLNNGPSRDDGGLFRLGLPDGLTSRLIRKNFGEKLTVFFISRIDQIFFKLYASVDQFGSYHADDLDSLEPTQDELIEAAKWSMSHDPSEGYRFSMKLFLSEFGYGNVAEKI